MRTPKQSHAGCAIVGSLFFFAIALCFTIALLRPQPASPDRDDAPMWTYWVSNGGGFYLPAIALAVLAIKFQPVGRRIMQLYRAHPNEPWMWRRQWADRKITDVNGDEAFLLWFMAIWLACATMPIVWLALRHISHPGPHDCLALAGLIFDLGLFGYALRATRRKLEFGTTTFELQTLPATPGGELAGTLRFDRSKRFPNGINLRLVCIKMERLPGGRSSVERILWHDEQVIEPISVQASSAAVPVHFAIPVDAHPTDDSQRLYPVLWRLEARAADPVSNYAANFVVPVFAAGAGTMPSRVK